jgi:hypothetical protein
MVAEEISARRARLPLAFMKQRHGIDRKSCTAAQGDDMHGDKVVHEYEMTYVDPFDEPTMLIPADGVCVVRDGRRVPVRAGDCVTWDGTDVRVTPPPPEDLAIRERPDWEGKKLYGSQGITLQDLRDALETLDGSAPVVLEGCDCLGWAAGVTIKDGKVVILRKTDHEDDEGG